MEDTTKVTKTYYSLRAAVLVLKALCKSSMTNPSVSCTVNLDHRKSLEVRMSRPGYSSMGYHEGTETATILVPIVSRKDITGSNSGIFDLMDLWLLDFDSASIFEHTSPEEHSDENGEGYYPPDDDFWWMEFQREVEFPVTGPNRPCYEFTTRLDGEAATGRYWYITSGHEQYVWNLDVLGTDAWDDHLVNDLDGFSA